MKLHINSEVELTQKNENMVMLLVQLDLEFAYAVGPGPYVCSSIHVLWCLSAVLLSFSR